MKLYCLDGGYIKTEKHYLTAGRGIGDPFDSPMCMFLIDHPKGSVLYDTGLSIEVARDCENYLGKAILAAYVPVMTEDQAAVNAVGKAGFKPDDIDFVVISHLHFDHAGGVGEFPNATYIVQAKELEYAYNPPSYMASGYQRADFDKGVSWYTLNGWLDNGFDLFGDGSVQLYYTPGHTPGHTSLLVNLPKSGPMLLTQDACYTFENLDGVLPGLMDHAEATLKSVDFFKLKQKAGVTIIPGHDPEYWKTMKKAPHYYE